MGEQIARAVRGILLAGLTWVLLTSPAAALDPERSIQQLMHTRWTFAEGAPPSIYALAQGKDGYLWIASSTGVFRFDGVAFEHIPPAEPKDDVWRATALLAASDGTIWVGYENGALATFRNGVFQRDASMPKTDAFTMRIAETSDGAIWIAAGRPDRALLRRAGGRWREIGADWGLPAESVIDMFAARDGSLWVTTVQSLLVLRKGSQRFQRIGAPHGHGAVSEDPMGRIWLSDRDGSRAIEWPPHRVGGPIFPTPGAKRNFSARFDRDGNLWGVNDDGVFRVRSPSAMRDRSRDLVASRVERFMAKDGLTSDASFSYLEDREGNVWIGTTLGLDRFRPANVVPAQGLGPRPMWGYALLGATDGAVYIGVSDGLYRVAPGGEPRRVPGVRGEIHGLCEGPDGSIWVVQPGWVLRIKGTAVMRVALPAGHTATSRGCAVDSHNVFLLNNERAGLSSYGSGGWRLHPPVRPEDWARLILSDPERGTLAVLQSGSLVRIDSAGRTVERLAQLDAGDVTTIYPGRRSVLLGGVFGIGRPHNGQLQTTNRSRIPWLAQPSGIVEATDGLTWLIGRQGIVGVRSSELERAIGDPRAPLSATILGFEDGLFDRYARENFKDAAFGGDGRLWFAITSGVVWVDPARFVRNLLAPPVSIPALIANGVRYRDPRTLTLAKGTSSVAIQYTGLSLTIPSRVRFRYQLEDVDEGWVDAGARRDVYYTNLGPGTYRFRVIAANNDGVWNREGATLEFTIPPTFLQSIWFKLLCLVGLCGLAGGVYALHLRQVTARLQNRFEIRIAERERIARELHDTLLQGFQGLMLRFQAVANRIPADGALRASLEEALESADAVLIEGRARVRELRNQAAEGDLAQGLLDAAAKVVDHEIPRVQLTVEGGLRPLRTIVHEEAQRIGEEAIRNAVRHASAANITLLLTYGEHELRMSVRDDGTGMPLSILAQGQKEGHFGLTGMRERAQQIGGRLLVTSRQAAGTEVALVIPARVAYADSRPPLLARWRAWRNEKR